MRIATFLLADALLVANAWIGTAQLRLRRPLDEALAFAVLAYAQVLVSLLVAGAALRSLRPGVALGVTAVCTVLLVVLQRWRPVPLRPRLFASVGDLLPRRAEQLRRNVRLHPWSTALALLATTALCWRIVILFALPPYAWDALWYHLTSVGGWLQAGRIEPSRLTAEAAVFPANGELLMTWPALFLRSDVLVGSIQIGSALVGAMALAGLARRIGCPAAASVAAGSLYLLTPVVITQAATSYVDLTVASMFLAALYFALGLFDPDGRAGAAGLAALAGTAAGIATGSKSNGLVFGAAVALLVVVGLLRKRRAGDPSGILAPLLAVAVPLVAFGSYWYIRDWVHFGNPFYPVRIRALGWTIFPGSAGPREIETANPGGASWWLATLRAWKADAFGVVAPHLYQQDGRPSGFGPQFAFIALPLTVVFLVQSIRHRSAATIALVITLGAVFLLQPYKWWSRFTIGTVAAIAILGLVWAVEAAPRRLARVLQAATVLLVCVSLYYSSVKINIGYGVVLKPRAVLRDLADRPTIGELALPDFRWVDGIDPKATISVDTYVGRFSDDGGVHFFSPLFGPHYSHHVYPLRGDTAPAVLADMAARGSTYAFVANTGRLERLLRSSPCLRSVYADEQVHVYRRAASCPA